MLCGDVWDAWGREEYVWMDKMDKMDKMDRVDRMDGKEGHT